MPGYPKGSILGGANCCRRSFGTGQRWICASTLGGNLPRLHASNVSGWRKSGIWLNACCGRWTNLMSVMHGPWQVKSAWPKGQELFEAICNEQNKRWLANSRDFIETIATAA